MSLETFICVTLLASYRVLFGECCSRKFITHNEKFKSKSYVPSDSISFCASLSLPSVQWNVNVSLFKFMWRQKGWGGFACLPKWVPGAGKNFFHAEIWQRWSVVSKKSRNCPEMRTTQHIKLSWAISEVGSRKAKSTVRKSQWKSWNLRNPHPKKGK